jgi:hypothetical protein
MTTPETPSAKKRWSTRIVLLWSAVGVVMTLVGWYALVEGLIFPSSNLALTDFRITALPELRRGRATGFWEFTIEYVLTKNRRMSLRSCVARVTHDTQDVGGRYESASFNLTTADEKIAKQFVFKARRELQDRTGRFIVTCGEGFQTDVKVFRFPDADT